MIRVRSKPYELYVLDAGVDNYGQTNTSKSKTADIYAYIQPYSQALVNNPKYNEVKLVGVTSNKILNLNQFLLIDNKYYQIVEIADSPRYMKFLLRECS